MKITESKLRRSIMKKILSEVAEEEYESEMTEFSRSPSGRKMSQAGNKISSAGSAIFGIAEDQTGSMSRTLYKISEFIGKLGEALSGLNSLEEGSHMSENLPSVSEYRAALKGIEKLERKKK